MAYDEMEQDMLGDQRTAMFVIISDTDDTFNFVVSILYTQLFNLLCDKVDDEHRWQTSVPCAAAPGRVCKHRPDSKVR